MSRQALRQELERTWVVYEPRVRGVPITKRDMADAEFAEERPAPAPAPDMLPSDAFRWGLLGRLAR